jgi:cytosine deaminase
MAASGRRETGLVTYLPARLMKLSDYGIAVGNPADLVVLDSAQPSDALAELAEPCMVFKNGRQTVRREPAQILREPARHQGQEIPHK